MVKKKQTANKENPQPVTPEEAQKQFFQQIGKVINDAIAPIAEKLDKVEQEAKANTRRMNTIAKQADNPASQPPQTNPAEMFKMVMDFINGPVGNRIVEALAGGSEPPPVPVETPISETERNYLLEVKKTMDSMQTRWMEAMTQQQENIVKKQQKELESEW